MEGRGRAKRGLARGRGRGSMPPNQFPQPWRTAAVSGFVDTSKITESFESTPRPGMESAFDDLSSRMSQLTCSSSAIPDQIGVIRSINPNFNKFGTDGQEIKVITNYYEMNKEIVMQNAMAQLGSEEMIRNNFYNPHEVIKFSEDRLTLHPGFITAIRNHMAGTLLCIDVTHLVRRTCSVYDVIIMLLNEFMSAELYQQRVREELEDMVVITLYNRKIYRIKSINFNINPGSSFKCRNGKFQTFAEYYKNRFNVSISPDKMHQPILIVVPMNSNLETEDTHDIGAIPSLCCPIGLNDSMQKNFQLMQRLSPHLDMNPDERKKKLDHFMKNLETSVNFNLRALESVARVLPREKIVVGSEDHGPIYVDEKGYWNMRLIGRKVLIPEHLRQWIIFTPHMASKNIPSFINVLKQTGSNLGIEVADPVAIVEYRQLREYILDDAYRAHGSNVNFVFFILPTYLSTEYADVKHFCSLTWGVASQCFLAKDMRANNLTSICTKVMIQVTAKLCGVPWSIQIPLKKLMVLGFDVYPCSGRKGESAAGLVASSTPSLTSFTSVLSFHKNKAELSNNLYADMTTCLEEYYKGNGFLPDRIIMYRGGVTEDETDEKDKMSYILQYELEQVKLTIGDVYTNYKEVAPKLTFIIVSKNTNSRAFQTKLRGRIENLSVGTVIDRTITFPERYDFFLVSEHVCQGTVSPTYYNVIYDESEMSADKMQRLTYKLCHLYFNCSQTVAVPAPCQYAHKLARLTGIALNKKVPEGLNSKLWYL